MSELEAVFRKEKVIPMAVVQGVLRTNSRMTAFRKLTALNYVSSYSHRGMYYTLEDIPDYDEYGVWSFKAVHFCEFGTLLNAVTALVKMSTTGCTAAELREILHVRVQNEVKQLHDSDRLIRRQLADEYVYFYPGKFIVQQSARKAAMAMPFGTDTDEMSEHLHSLLSALNEKQRRLYLGFESLKLGSGGDSAVASATGVNVKTVTRGRHELVSREVTLERVRAAGAGRTPLKKTIS